MTQSLQHGNEKHQSLISAEMQAKEALGRHLKNGKVRLNAKSFYEEASSLFLLGSLDGVERVLYFLNSTSPELTMDELKGELHLFLQGIANHLLVDRAGNSKQRVEVEHFLNGRFGTPA